VVKRTQISAAFLSLKHLVIQSLTPTHPVLGNWVRFFCGGPQLAVGSARTFSATKDPTSLSGARPTSPSAAHEKRDIPMADFTIPLARTLQHEGGYANIKGDRGGETYRGIARNFHSSWPGWQLIDEARPRPNFPKPLDQDTRLQSLVADFYKVEFWDKIAGDKISSQPVANELFDCAVNMGVTTAVRILQKSVNALMSPESPPLAEDAVIGPKTIEVLNSWLSQPALHPEVASNAFLSMMLVLRGTRYIDIIEGNPSQRQFAYGWFRRIFSAPEIERRNPHAETPS
jgi:lysozyme family protein